MRILIYEPVHLDWIIPLADALESTSHDILFVTSETMKADIMLSVNMSAFQWIFLLNKISTKEEFKSLQRAIRSFTPDVFWLNTASSRHLLYYFLKKQQPGMKLIVNIHEVNNHFSHLFQFSLRSGIRSYGKKKLRSITDAYVVNAKAMKIYVEENSLTNKPIFHIAPVIHKPSTILSKNKISIVIPGTVEEKRRDYRTPLHAFRSLMHTRSADEIELVLAGRFCDTSLLPLIQPLTNIKWFENEIDEHTFQNLVSNATILLSPQTVHTIGRDGIEEIYGTTKNSGNSYDAIRHAKPMIIPADLNVPEEINHTCIRYNNEAELLSIFQQILSDQKFISDLSIQAGINAKAFTKEALKNRIEGMLLCV